MGLLSNFWRFYEKYPVIVAFAAVFPLLYFPLFYRLDYLPILMWDESRQAINTYEMIKSGNPFVTTFNDDRDHYNTKPPLLIWLQSLGWLIFKSKELALRFPSALAGLATCFTFIWFSNRAVKSAWAGALSAILLVSVDGFIDLHVTRTGDYDALLTLFTTLFIMHFFLFIRDEKVKNLGYFYLFLGLAIGAKAAAPLMFLPGLLLSVIFFKKFKWLLFQQQTYKYSLIFLGLLIVFYGIRLSMDNGYAQAVWYNDFGGRFMTSIDNHTEVFEYYWLIIWDSKATFLITLMPLCLLSLFWSKEDNFKPIAYLLLNAFFFLLLISIAKTKIFWYAAPLYPLMALAVGLSVFQVLKKLATIKKQLAYAVGIIFMGYIVAFPYAQVIDKVIKNPYFDWENQETIYAPSHYLRKIYNQQIESTKFTFLHDNHYIPFYDIYIRLINDNHKLEKISIQTEGNYILNKGDNFLLNESKVELDLRKEYQIVILDSIATLKYGTILEKKLIMPE